MNKNMLNLNIPEISDFRYTEAIKTLRTNIQFSGSNIKNILITSTAPNEGKSTIAINLAIAFAQSGKKTCYIDADLRKSVLISRYDVKGKTLGLSEMLSGQVEFEKGIYKSNYENLDIVLSGPHSPVPTELFEDLMCEKFFKYIKDQNYDFVIIDSAPLGTVIDAAILARYSDGVALIAESEVTTKKLFRKVKTQLDRTGVRLLGVILNKVKMDKGSYYSSYYKSGYGYGDYGYGKE